MGDRATSPPLRCWGSGISLSGFFFLRIRMNSTGFENGWIKLWRKILDSPLWKMRYQDRILAITCIILANHKPNKFSHKGTGEDIPVESGQFVTTIRNLAVMANMSIQETRTSLRHLEKSRFLTQQSTRWYSLVTICNWALYQSASIEANTGSNITLTQPQHRTISKECKNKEYIVQTQEIVAFWNGFEVLATHGEKKEIWKRIQAEVKAKLRNKLYTVEKIKMGIRIYAHVLETSDFYAGGDHKSKWDLPTFLKRRNGLAELIADPISYVAQRTKVPLPFCPDCGGELAGRREKRKGKEGKSVGCKACGKEWLWETVS